MRRLTGADAHFLLLETRVQHLHTLKIFVVEGSSASGVAPHVLLREQLARIVPHLGPYRWRLVRVPLGLGLPFWATTQHIDLDYHIRRLAVPAPGGPREFCEVASAIASFPLERDRPLWQIWIVEGLEHGRIAYVMKIHHAIGDGTASAQLAADTVAALATNPATVGDPDAAEPLPPRLWLLAQAVADGGRRLVRLPALIGRSLRVLAIGAARRRAGLAHPPRAYASPPTRFNNRLTPHRWYANITVPLADMKLVKEAFGVTLNDVLVALTSSAVRGYLADHDELPAESLTASIPVSIRAPEDPDRYGNRLASWYVQLATDVADPVERLRAVARNTATARTTLQAKDLALQSDWQEQWLSWVLFMGPLLRLMRRFRKRPVYYVIISNVRGPSAAFDHQGARVVSIQSMGPLQADMGLNVTAWSYVDQFSIGVVACHEHVPDIWNLAERFPAALEELKAAAILRRDPAAARESHALPSACNAQLSSANISSSSVA
jgi:WS/DGAT/MGAT family acyltransferase